jgi:Pectinacetylesterase
LVLETMTMAISRDNRCFVAVSAALLACALSACGGEGPEAQVAGKAAPVLGDPIDAPSEEWVWVPIEGTQCADGTEAGVGVNFTSQSRNLVVWFQGNGVCYDQATCTIFQPLLTGMGADPLSHLWWGDPTTPHLGIFDRNDPDNPFRADSYVAFPHCGVDGHTADKDTTYDSMPTVHQHGYANVTHALPRILSTFKDATRVVVAGFSAGGIGAGANYHQIATGFEGLGKPSPFLIVDAGPILPPPYSGELATTSLRNGWGTDKTIDTWCTTCAKEGYHTGYRELARLHPGLRSAIISAYADTVATSLYALLNADSTFDGARFELGLRALATWTDGYQSSVSPSTHREFYYGGGRHGALVVAPLAMTPGIAQFLDDQLDDSKTWTTVEP